LEQTHLGDIEHMTVVIGKRFGETITLLSDTMITDTGARRHDIIPGQLKSIILSDRLSVAYAGHAGPALAAIGKAPSIFTTKGLTGLLNALCEVTSSNAHDVEFMVAAHNPTAELRRVWQGQVSGPLDDSCIGNHAILTAVFQRFSPVGDPKADAFKFRTAFIDAFTDQKVFLGAGVGGFPIVLQALPSGHVYKGHTVNSSWKPIEFVPRATIFEDENDLLTGEWSFRHDILATKSTGIAVLGAEVLQAKLGFVYAPLIEFGPIPVRLLESDENWTQHQVAMHKKMRAAFDAMVEKALSQKTQA
jgi:hypothetical protein